MKDVEAACLRKTASERPFSKDDKQVATQNMPVMGLVKIGVLTFSCPEDAERNLFVQCRQ